VTSSVRTGGTANGVPSAPRLGADGRTVIFQTWASDMADGDYNDKRDVFFLRLGSGDSDGDGMDDDWEMAFFGTLARDGKGDFDRDGATDLQEFLAGTDPTNTNSVLRAMTLTALGSGTTTVFWPAVSGKTYRVFYKDDVAVGTWTELAGPVILDGSTARILDQTAAGHTRRFYRVVVLP